MRHPPCSVPDIHISSNKSWPTGNKWTFERSSESDLRSESFTESALVLRGASLRGGDQTRRGRGQTALALPPGANDSGAMADTTDSVIVRA